MPWKFFQIKKNFGRGVFLSLTLIIALVITLLVSCYRVNYSDTGIKGIRKAERIGPVNKVTVVYEKFDPVTRRYFEAEQKADGKWYYTKDGKFLRDLNRDQVDGS